jgi:hypothetical protein
MEGEKVNNDWGSHREYGVKVDGCTTMYSDVQVDIVLMLLDNKFCTRKSLSKDIQELVFKLIWKLKKAFHEYGRWLG